MFVLFIIIMSFIYTFAVRNLLYKNLVFFDFLKSFFASILMTLFLMIFTGHFYGLVYFFSYLCFIHFLEFRNKLIVEREARYLVELERAYEKIKRNDKKYDGYNDSDDLEEEIHIANLSSNNDNSKIYKIMK